MSLTDKSVLNDQPELFIRWVDSCCFVAAPPSCWCLKLSATSIMLCARLASRNAPHCCLPACLQCCVCVCTIQHVGMRSKGWQLLASIFMLQGRCSVHGVSSCTREEVTEYWTHEHAQDHPQQG